MTATNTRVVITGIGMVTPLGDNFPDTVAALERRESAKESVVSIEGSSQPLRVIQIESFQPRQHFRVPKALKLANRRTELAVAAATMAIENAGLSETSLEGLRHEVLIGCSSSDLRIEELAQAVGYDPDGKAATNIPFFSQRILDGLNPLWLLTHLPNMVSAHVAIQLEATGPNSTLMTSGVAGQQAIGEGFRSIQSGETDVVLAGGADSGVSLFDIACFARDGLFSTQSDVIHLAAAEGSAVLVLENYVHAKERGARFFCEIRSHADCGPTAQGAIDSTILRSIHAVLEESDWRGHEVDCISSALSGNRDLDAALASAYEKALGLQSEVLQHIEFDSRLGHTFAASGPISCALLADRLSRHRRFDKVVSHALSYSGHSISIAMQRTRKKGDASLDSRTVT